MKSRNLASSTKNKNAIEWNPNIFKINELKKFKTQLDEGAYIVLKGDTYLITKIISNTELYIAPGYKANGFTNYKTVIF